MYADGSFVTQADIPKIGPGSSNLIFGKSPAGGNRMIGSLDDVRFYDRELSGAEASTLYGSGNGDFVTVRTGTMASIKKAGTITLTGYAPGTTNMYGATPISKTVTVSKAPLTVTGDDFSINVGNAMPTLTSQTTGWKNGDTHTSLSTQVSVTTDASNSNTAGTYYVRPGGAASDKYVMTYVDGQLIITNKTPQSISWGQDFSSAAINQIIDLNASASSNLPVTYAVSDTSKAELAVTLQSNLDSWWKLDETSATTVADSSGSGSSSHTAVLIGTDGSTNWTDPGPPVARQGKFGGALTLDGTNDYGYTSGYKGITGSSRRTLSLWFKTSTANKPLITYGTAGTGTLFKVSINGSGAAVLDLGGVSITAGSGMANGAWHHFAATVPFNGNSGGVKVYINGSVTNGSGTTAINTSSGTNSEVKIGFDGSAFFSGQIDDIRLYNAELNASTIAKVYGGGTGDFNRLKVKASGQFSVSASQGGNGTFATAPVVTENLNIGKLNQTIAFSPITDKSIGDFDFDPGASASSSLPVTYTSSAPLIASVEGTTPGSQKIKVRAAGTVTITASQAGDASYNPAPNATQSFTVGYFNLFANSLPGLKLWLDGNSVDSDHSTADSIANGTAIGSWKDRSSSTNHATQGTISNRPAYVANGLNGKGILNYTASQSSDITSDSSIRTIVSVLRQAGGQTSTSKPFGGNLFATTSNGKFGLQRQGSGMIDSGSSSKNFAVVTLQMASGNYAIYVNGIEKGTGTDPNTPAAFDKIGNDFAGDIAEVVAYDRSFNASVRQKLEGYLAHKWGLTDGFSGSHNYKVAKPAFGGTQVLTFQPLSDKQVNQTVNLLVSADSGLSSFTYDSNDSTVVSFTGNVATGLKVGKVRITATQSGDGNWLPASAYQDWIVTATPRSDQTITFNAIPNKNALSANFTLNATASSTLPVTYQVVSGSNVATVTSSGTVDVLGTGVATIRASQDGNASFNPAPTVEQTLTVSKAAQTITFGALPNQNLSAGVYTLSASASSGLGVSFTSSDSTIASVSGNVATLVAGGTVQITANQGGNSIYAAATPVTQNLTIIDDTLQTQTITWTQNLSSLTFGLADINMTATANSNLPITYTITSGAGVIDINGTKLKVLGAGNAVVTASQNGNGQWAAASTVDKSIVVSKSNQVIVRANNNATLLNLTKDSGDSEFTPMIKSVKQGTTTETGLPITYTSSNTNVVQVTGANSRLKFVGGGTATITANQVGSSGYNPANSKTFTITVTELSPYTDSLPNLVLWLDGKDVNADRMPESPSNFLAQAKVSSWSDRSGNGNSLTQANSVNHPTYESSGGLRFDGNSDFLDATLPSLLQGNPAFTIFVVAESSQNGGRLLQLGNSNGNGYEVIGFHESGSVVYNDGNHSASQNFTTSATIGVWKKSLGNTNPGIQFSRFGSNISLTAPSNPQSINLPAHSSIVSSTIHLGRGYNGTSNDYFKGIIREVLVFTKELDDYFQKRVEGYLANKWGSKASLASQHPFKVTPPTFGGSQSINLAHTNLGVDVSDNVPFMSIFDAPFKLAGSYATSGLPITYETNSSSVLSVDSAGLLKPQGVGKVRVTLKQAGDSHFSAASNLNFNMKILGKRSQSITFGAIPDKRPGDGNFTISAASSSGLPVSYASSDTSIATVTSGGTVSIQANGQVTITASQPGDATYASAANVDQSFTIGDLMTISFDPIGTMGNSQSFKVRAWANDARNGALLNGTTGISIVYAIVSGPASISGNNVTTNASGSGTVVIKATVSGSTYAPGIATISFNVDSTGIGQSITFNKDVKGGLRDMQLSRRPIILGRMATSDSNLPITFTLIDNPNKVAKIVGVGNKAQLLIAPKDGNNGEKFSGFGGSSDLTIKIRASQAGGTYGGQQYHAALSVDHIVKIKKPGKSAFYEERRLDSRFDTKKAAFDTRMARMGKSGDKAAYLFNRDDQDSDGDGLSNLEERAFGGDSLMGDKRTARPQAIRKGDGYEYISFKRYQDAYNDGDDRIEYIVETSRDLRTWTTDSDSTNGPLQVGNAVDMGGGMEKVVYRSRQRRTDNGGKQLYIRVRVKSK
jgi:hypothetical protein